MDLNDEVKPNAPIWLILMSTIGFFSPWFAILLHNIFSTFPQADESVKIILSLSVFTIIILVIKTIKLLSDFDKKRIMLSAALTTACVISLIVAIIVYTVQ